MTIKKIQLGLIICLIMPTTLVCANSEDDDFVSAENSEDVAPRKRKLMTEKLDAAPLGEATEKPAPKNAILEYMKSPEGRENAKETVKCCGAFGLNIFRGIRKKQGEKKDGEKLEPIEIVEVVVESLVNVLTDRKVLAQVSMPPLIDEVEKRHVRTRVRVRKPKAAEPVVAEETPGCCSSFSLLKKWRDRKEYTPASAMELVEVFARQIIKSMEENLENNLRDLSEAAFRKLTELAIEAAIEELKDKKRDKEAGLVERVKADIIEQAKIKLRFIKAEIADAADEARTTRVVEAADPDMPAIDTTNLDREPFAVGDDWVIVETPRIPESPKVKRKIRTRKLRE